jgi:hypothetical protein
MLKLSILDYYVKPDPTQLLFYSEEKRKKHRMRLSKVEKMIIVYSSHAWIEFSSAVSVSLLHSPNDW